MCTRWLPFHHGTRACTRVRTRVPWYSSTCTLVPKWFGMCDVVCMIITHRAFTLTYHWYSYQWYLARYVRTRVPWYVRTCRCVLPCIRSLSQLAAVYPPKTHVVLSAHVCPFPIRKLWHVYTCTYVVHVYVRMAYTFTYDAAYGHILVLITLPMWYHGIAILIIHAPRHTALGLAGT